MRPDVRPGAVPRLVVTIALTTFGWAAVRPASVLALVGDVEMTQAAFSTETLDPPTGLSASAALLLRVNLSWTATVDARATGYRVLRGTANGGPYAQVATIGSASTTTYQDTVPLPGQYFYVLRTTFASWTSVNSNQASLVAV